MKNPNFDEEYISQIKSNLSNENFKIRRNCLEELRNNIESEIKHPESNVALCFFKLVIKVFSDSAESCREKAVHLALICLELWSLPDDEILFLLLPAIQKRLGCGEGTEISEEIRLLQIRLLKFLLQKYKEKLTPFIVDLVDILNRCIQDRSPNVIKESCDCLEEMAKTLPEFRLHSGKFIDALISATKHKHYRIRVAAINSFEPVILYGQSGSMKVVCGALGECLLDQSPHVRRAVYKVVFSWLVKLRDRHSYFHCMLPLILTGINDENPDYREDATNWWHEIGLQYLRENEDHLKDKDELLPAKLEHYPFEVERPSLGCRTLVSKEIGNIIPALLKELEDWKPEVRIKSSELLEVIVLHAEINIVTFLDKMLPVLCRVCAKREEIVYQRIEKSAEIIGYFIAPRIYWHLMVPKMKEDCSLGQYAIFASLLKNSPKIEISQELNDIISVMVENNFCDTRDVNSLQYLLRIISNLIECCKCSLVNNIALKNLYTTIVSVMAFDDENIQIQTADLLGKLALIIPSTVRGLNELCLPSLFDRLVDTCNLWESYSLNLNIFVVLLRNYTDDAFQLAFDKLMEILHVVLKPNGDKEIIFKILYAIATTLQKNDSESSSMAYFEKIILGPLKQQLVWKAGRVSEVIRATALSIILLFLKQNGNMSPEFLSEIVPLVISSCEDSYDETRLYSLEILSCIGLYGGRNINSNLFKNILTVTAGRLEDAQDLVRLKAIQSLRNILLNAPRLESFKEMPDFENVTKALKLVLINADDNNEKIQSAVLELFNEPQIVRNVKSVISEDFISSFISKCCNKNVSTMLEMYLKI